MADESGSTDQGEFPSSTPFSEIAQGLTGHDYGKGQPTEASEPATESAEPAGRSVRVAEAEPAERRPTAEPTRVPIEPEKTVTVRGKTYTVSALQSELAKDPDFAVSLATTHNQFNDLRTQLDQERARRTAELERQVAQAQQAAAPVIDPLQRKQEIVALYGPKVQHAIEREGFNPNLAADYPDHAAELLYYRDVIFGMGAAVLNLQSTIDNMTVGSSRREYQAAHERALDSLAGADPFFEGLKDAAHRGEFKKYISQLDPSADLALDPNQLQGLYLAFSKTPVLEAVRAGSREHKAAEDASLRGARGAARSTRAGGRPDGKPANPDEANFGALLALGAGR